MVLRDDAEGIWGGTLAADRTDGTLATFLGQTRPDVQAGPPMMFTGIHVIQPRFLDRVPPEGEQCIVRTAYRQLFHEPRASMHSCTMAIGGSTRPSSAICRVLPTCSMAGCGCRGPSGR